MTNAETITKLNNALNTLIKAYEELQNDNEGLKARINELEDEVLDLESAKEDLELSKMDLESNLSELNDHTEKDNSNITSMLGKIESLLNSTDEEEKKPNNNNTSNNNVQNNNNHQKKDEQLFEEKDIEKEVESTEPSSFDNLSVKVEEKKEEDSNSNKIDLNRMASLLNGFNN